MRYLAGTLNEADFDIRIAASNKTYLASVSLARGPSKSQRLDGCRLSYIGSATPRPPAFRARADLTTRGLAISFLTLESVAAREDYFPAEPILPARNHSGEEIQSTVSQNVSQ
jgi:hypothetical protein